MQEPPWLPRTNEEYLQQLVADAGPQPDEFIALQAELDAAGGEIAHLTALLAERDAEIERLREAGNILADYADHQRFSLAGMTAIEAWRAALAARGDGNG